MPLLRLESFFAEGGVPADDDGSSVRGVPGECPVQVDEIQSAAFKVVTYAVAANTRSGWS